MHTFDKVSEQGTTNKTKTISNSIGNFLFWAIMLITALIFTVGVGTTFVTWLVSGLPTGC